MYLGMRLFQMQQAEEVYEKEKRQRELEEQMSGPVAFAVPSAMEYVVVPPKDIPRLKAYIRSADTPQGVLRKAAKKGFPLYFQLFKSSFTNGEIYDILYNVTEEKMQKRPLIHCSEYNQMIHPALCLSRGLIYPKELPASLYYLEVKEKLKEAITKLDKKRLRKELKRHSPIMDPYPKCRGCLMGKRLVQESCLGAEFDPEDKDCDECPSKKECCLLMRLRIESILEGDEDEVKQDILKSWKRLSQNRKEVKREMAKKKRKAEEVTEEVIEETEGPKKKTKEEKAAARKAARAEKKKADEPTKTKAELRAEKRKAARAAAKEEGAPTSGKKKGKGKKEDVGSKVKGILKQLQKAKDDGDQDMCRKLRVELRAEGYSLRDHAAK